MHDNRSSRYPRRPPRLEARFSNLRPFYFVTFNTYRRTSLLACDDIPETFHLFCFRPQDHAVAVGRYVLMPDHAHLFVVLPPEGLRSRESYSQKWDYVRMNPVRAGLSQTPEDWPYQGKIVSFSFD
jgi:putative transposase